MKLAVYDTGFGLRITEDVGPSFHAIEMTGALDIRIKPPLSSLPYDEWYAQWQEQKRIVNKLVGVVNNAGGLNVKR